MNILESLQLVSTILLIVFVVKSLLIDLIDFFKKRSI
jgi:hypothetical protein